MNNQTLKITGSILLLLVFFSCKKDFLNIVPKGNKIASTVSDYNLLLNDENFYQQLSGGWQSAMLMGDEVSAEENLLVSSAVESQRLFQWEDVIFEPRAYAQDLSLNLGALYVVNKTISEIGEAEGPEAQKIQLKAEALANRAFLYFQTVNLYCKPYNPATASSDPGFPIIKEPNALERSFPRGTLQQNYDFMIADLQEAINQLPLKVGSRTRFSRAAAEGILGKIYLFAGRYQEALTMFNACFADMQGMGVRLYDYNVELAPGGSFLPISTYGPNGPANNLNDFTETILARTFYGGEFQGNGFGNDGLVLSEAAEALFQPQDLRLSLYAATFKDGSPNPDGRLRKYGQQYVKYGLELSELYLLRGECKARLNDLAGAKADVEALRIKRIPAPAAAVPAQISQNQNALIRFIVDERIREYAFSGYRWFDMRRLSADPLFSGLSYTHTLYKESGTAAIFKLRPERFVLRFPQTITVENPQLNNNP